MRIGQSNTYDEKNYQRRRTEDISRAVNGGLEFGQPPDYDTSAQSLVGINTNLLPAVNNDPNVNMNGYWVNTVTPAVGQSFMVTHNLGRIPTGMIVFSVDQPGAVIHSVNKSSWSKTTAQFASNMAGVSLQGFVS
jgi:hypothetical protein